MYSCVFELSTLIPNGLRSTKPTIYSYRQLTEIIYVSEKIYLRQLGQCAEHRI